MGQRMGGFVSAPMLLTLSLVLFLSSCAFDYAAEAGLGGWLGLEYEEIRVYLLLAKLVGLVGHRTVGLVGRSYSRLGICGGVRAEATSWVAGVCNDADEDVCRLW